MFTSIDEAPLEGSQRLTTFHQPGVVSSSLYLASAPSTSQMEPIVAARSHTAPSSTSNATVSRPAAPVAPRLLTASSVASEGSLVPVQYETLASGINRLYHFVADTSRQQHLLLS